MGVYVDIKLENGKQLAYVEIVREATQQQPRHSMPPMEPGRYQYKFKARVTHPRNQIAWTFEDSAEHERSEDVLALLQVVIERVQEMQKGLEHDADKARG